MSDQTNAVGFTGERQTPEPSQTEEQKPAQPEVLTPEYEKLRDDVSETVFRRVQGLLDRQTEHLSKALQAPSPASEPSESKPAKAAKGEQVVDPVTADGWKMMEDAGVQINEHDPEAYALSQAKSPREFFAAIETAIEAKRQRTSTEPEEQGATPQRTPTNLGGIGAPTPKATEDDYKIEMYAARGQGALKGREIKDKYRKMGVPVDTVILK